MPIESPQLDDLSYDRVVTDLVRRIPVYAPEWTDHNDSDPGITLIHLFAQLAEQVGYRLNLVPEKSCSNSSARGCSPPTPRAQHSVFCSAIPRR
jgi:hypothetical protein